MTTGNDLSRLMKFLERDNWAARFDEVVGEHFGPIMDEFDLQFDEIGALVGEHWAGILWGAAFEDFLTQTFENEDTTFPAIYLKRLGWRSRASKIRWRPMTLVGCGASSRSKTCANKTQTYSAAANLANACSRRVMTAGSFM